MITTMSKHAWERLQERRGARRKEHVFNKIKKWSAELPDDGIFYRNRWVYVAREGVLVTVMRARNDKDLERFSRRNGLELYVVEEA